MSRTRPLQRILASVWVVIGQTHRPGDHPIGSEESYAPIDVITVVRVVHRDKRLQPVEIVNGVIHDLELT